jgi:Flp pilus assembly protein TadG
MTFFLRYVAHLTEPLRRAARDRRGAVAVTYAIACVPIMLAVGAGIDYSYAAMVRTKLNALADAAALSAVNQASMSLSVKSAKRDAEKLFNAQAKSLKRTKNIDVTATITQTGNERKAVVVYSANVPTTFMGLAGIQTVEVAGTSTAASATPTYIDFYLLLDNTPSMGVGATTADINKLIANTPDQCAFACHDLSAAPNDYYGLAKKLGVQMRIDVMRTATQRLMDTAGSIQIVTSQFRVAIYTFGLAATAMGLTPIQPITTNLALAKTSASLIDLMTIPYQNYASDTQTNFHTTLADMNKVIPASGDGSTSGSPQKILFFVSDGVADRALGSPGCSQPTTAGSDPKTAKKYTRCQEPLDVALCTTIKNRGIRIAVLYTTYLPLPTNAWYNSWIAPFSSTIATRMEACASPGLYFEVSPSQGISEAMDALFKKAVQHARLVE